MAQNNKGEQWATSNLPFQSIDEYREQYVSHPIPPRISFKPNYVPLVSGAFSGITESKEEYVSHPVHKMVKQIPKQGEWSRPENKPFEGHSVYDQDYKKLPIPKMYVHPKAEYQPNPNPLAGTTINHQDYRAWEIPKRFQRPKQEYHKTEGKLEDHSESNDKYRAWPVHKRPPPPKQVFRSPTEDRDFTSTVQSDFVSHNVERRKAKAAVKWSPSEGKFNGESINQSDYKTWVINRVQPIKPSYIDSLTHSSQFEGVPESKDMYQVWPTPKRPQKRIAKYAPSEAKFDGISSQKSDYKVWGLNKVQPIKPSQVDSLTHASQFEGVTENQDEYRQWPTTNRPQKRIMPYVPSSAQFEGITTQKTDYRAFEATAPRSSFRPQMKYKPITEDRDFLSETKAAITRMNLQEKVPVAARRRAVRA